MTEQSNAQGTDQPVGRRGLIRSGAAGGAAALLAATGGPARATSVAPPPVDSSFADFSLIKINSNDDSLTRIQRKAWSSPPRTIGPIRFSTQRPAIDRPRR